MLHFPQHLSLFVPLLLLPLEPPHPLGFISGINKPDVRYVIHHSMPKTLTHFYQESGRAGRDGLDSKCIVFFAYRDKARLEVCMILKITCVVCRS